MNNFTLRTLAGLIFVIVIVFGVWLSYVSMILLFAFITSLGLWEFYSLVDKSGFQIPKIIGVATSLLSWLALVPLVGLSPLYFVVVPGVLFFYELFQKNNTPFVNVAYTLLGLLYITLPFYLMAWYALNFYPHDNEAVATYYPYLLLGVFFLIWANDTFAYLAGRAFGKTKLFERISPKKTKEGALGGGIGTIITALIISRFYTEYTWMDWSVIALIVAVAGTLGDLVESMFKRSINVKDSGNIIPGHGGILDRFDSFLLAAPMVFVYVCLFR